MSASICTDLGRCAYDVAEEVVGDREGSDTPCEHWADCFPGRPPLAPVVQPTVCPTCGSEDRKHWKRACALLLWKDGTQPDPWHSGVIDTPEELPPCG